MPFFPQTHTFRKFNGRNYTFIYKAYEQLATKEIQKIIKHSNKKKNCNQDIYVQWTFSNITKDNPKV